MARISNHKGFNIKTGNHLSNIKEYAKSLSQKAKDISDKLNSYIIIHFKELLTTQSHSIKICYNKGKEVTESMNKKYNQIMESMKKYFSSCRDCEQMAFDLDKDACKSKKERIHQKMLTVKKEADANYDNYSEAIKSYNEAICKYTQSIQKVIENYNSYEEKRCKILEESLDILNNIFLPSKSFEKVSIKPYIYDINPFFIDEISIEYYEGMHPLFQGTGSSFSYLNYSLLESSGSSHGTQTAVEELYKSEIGGIVDKA